MAEYLRLTQEDRSGGYIRADIRRDVLYAYCKIRDVAISVSRVDGTVTRIADDMADKMLNGGFVTKAQYDAYLKNLSDDIYHFDRFDEYSSERLYNYIAKVRKANLGNAVDNYLVKLANSTYNFTPNGIDQGNIKEQLLKRSKAVIFAVTQAEMFSLMLNDINTAKNNEIWVLCDSSLVGLLPQNVNILTIDDGGIFYNKRLQSFIDRNDACLIVYGEEGLTSCRGLLVDAVVYANPNGYLAQAVTGLWSGEGCTVYVPKGLDITKYVPVTQKTRLNYSILYSLWKECGDKIYNLTVEQLYSQYPQFFVNIYSGKNSDLPLNIKAESLSEFDRQLDEGLRDYLSSFDNAEYKSAYFDKELEEQPICYDSTQKQNGILVQAVKIKKAEDAKVISCEKGKTPRQTFEKHMLSGVGIVSNFLFFMTPKLGVLYNDLRKERALEQADASSGHLDYMRIDNKETFPLFAKSCIAKKEDGRFLFFNHKLGGGRVCISGISFSWKKEDVNSDISSVRVYAPSYAAKDRDADRNTYKIAVGEGRVNIVLLRDKVTCIRKGDVLLPSVGVVLSLAEEAALPLLEKCDRLNDGYYDISGLTLDVKLDSPEGIEKDEWEKVSWAYGGGLTLIRDGIGLCDGDNMEKWFDEEGWTNPLSRQTQESNLHSLVKHPRTAIGCTKEGSLVILVFSGRTWRSTGADYAEMITIARRLFPDIQYLMNCDGGGSAMLGMVKDGSFLELSFPSTSSGSCAGQVRPINTVFYIPIE
ncbi:MAG: phosphodiester glycosidase family protein [Clostridia bacterium]|nr:phosphodiester glycosidase family protein [Clostridia bacterium]